MRPIARNSPRSGTSTRRAFRAKRGLAYPDIVEAAVGKKIRALWIIATNPLVSFPNQDVLRQALSNLDFLVVQDGFHPTPTTELADLVLPAAIWGEKEGTYTNSERRVSKVNERSSRPAKRARISISFSPSPSDSAAAKNCFPAGTRPRMRSTNGGASRAGGSAITPASTYDLLDEQAPCSGRSRRRRPSCAVAALRGRRVSRLRTAAPSFVCAEWEPFPGAAEPRVSVRAEYRAHGGALAHAHQDARGRRFWSACRRAPGSK